MLFVSLQCVDILNLRFFYLFTSNSFLVNSNCLASVSASCRLFSAVSTWIRILRILGKFWQVPYSFIRQKFVLSSHLWQTFHYYLFIQLLKDPFLSSKETEEIIFWRLQMSISERNNVLFGVRFILFSDFKIIQVLIWNYFKKVKTIWFEFNKIL